MYLGKVTHTVYIFTTIYSFINSGIISAVNEY